eukprot:TRINITY_DN20861_c0_g1_i2.p1 TRINITY_DN20861_c0_g1~~TRINITY_DN20861_c0_g1_i2.p1  ORF type:complete len:208 (+),score=8.19 TRINITY_DN20861_c0_g1_i2:55-678(+)
MGVGTPECIRRLTNDYKVLNQNPPPYVKAHPDESNILCWHYTVEGPPESPYHGGLYHGKLEFPDDFPYNPPSVYMLTPNGRFKTGQRLCFSMSDFHPKEWNPLWSVSSILTGFLSFMLEEADTYGSIKSSVADKRELAKRSLSYNLNNKTWVRLFPDMADEARQQLIKMKIDDPSLTHSDTPPSASSSTGFSILMVAFAFILYLLLS